MPHWNAAAMAALQKQLQEASAGVSKIPGGGMPRRIVILASQLLVGRDSASGFCRIHLQADLALKDSDADGSQVVK
jgi:hypothetical protein